MAQYFLLKFLIHHGSDSSNAANLYVTAMENRVTGGEIVLYNFDEGSGNTIHDVSGVGTPLNLTINKPSTVSWSAAGLQVKNTALINSHSQLIK